MLDILEATNYICGKKLIDLVPPPVQMGKEGMSSIGFSKTMRTLKEDVCKYLIQYMGDGIHNENLFWIRLSYGS